MVNAEILGGLKLALSKGESLKRAMMTFYNAGYKREEIEEAARNLHSQGIERKEIVQQSAPAVKQEVKKEIKQPIKKQIIRQPQRVSDYGEPAVQSMPIKKAEPVKEQIKEPTKEKKEIVQQQKPKSKPISNYEQPPTTKGKLIIIFLIVSLLSLVGALIAVFLFKQELIDFFNRLS